jgi:glucosamine--fructose-6-phosphate aminotransferase (isomerizing)
LRQLPLYIEKALEIEGDCRKAAEKLADAEHLFFIGRGKDYDLCREASLKLKEVSYIHSEAYAAGELKHGTISLIESGTPVVALAADQTLLSKTAANVRELQARGALVLAIAPKEAPLPDCLRLNLPDCPAEAAPFLAAVLCQMIAYHTAKKRGNEIDQPRNLAKSVTVE